VGGGLALQTEPGEFIEHARRALTNPQHVWYKLFTATAVSKSLCWERDEEE